MHSFIMKITHSLVAKDTIAVVRGMYKVVEGGVNTYRTDNVDAKLAYSWHNKVDMDGKSQQSHTIKSQENVYYAKSQDIGLKTDKKAEKVQQNPSENSQSYANKINSSQEGSRVQPDLKHNPINKPTQKPQQQPQKQQKTYKQLLKNVKQQPKTSNVQDKVIKESKVPSSRVSRIFQFTKLGFNIAQSAVEAYFTKADGKDHSATYEKIANKITDELCKMRGAPLKLAQMLSIQEDKLIPTPIRKAFEKARQTAHILPTEEVLYMMEKNYGKQWRQKFIRFDEKPFASASIGQVHLATLPTKQDVAIKIQYPGVRKSIESDISNLGLLMKIPGVFPKGMYMERILKNTQTQLTQQCDYILEKQKQQAYEECLKLCVKEDADLYKVPKVFDEFTTEEVFVSEYLSGVTLKNIDQGDYPQQIKDEIGRRIMQLTFNELFEMGIVQSDPNPANFTYNFQKDQLNLFDFGATHIYKRKFLEDYYKIIEGSVLENKEQIWKSSIDTGFLTGEESVHMKDNHIDSIMIIGQPLRFKGKYDFGCQKITQKIYKTIPVMLKNRLKHPPEEVYSLHRKLSGSYLACMRLNARIDCSKIWEEIKFQRLIETIDLSEKTKLVL